MICLLSLWLSIAGMRLLPETKGRTLKATCGRIR